MQKFLLPNILLYSNAGNIDKICCIILKKIVTYNLCVIPSSYLDHGNMLQTAIFPGQCNIELAFNRSYKSPNRMRNWQ